MKAFTIIAIILICVIVRAGERCVMYAPDGVCCIEKAKK